MFGTPAFGTPSSTPAFGTSTFGTPSSTPAFGTPSTTSAFGTPSSTPAFGAPSSTPGFGASTSTPLFSTPSSAPAFGASTPLFSTPSSTPGFGGSLFGSSSAFNTPSIFGQTQQQQQTTPFQQQNTGFGLNTSSFGTPQQQQQPSPFGGLQLQQPPQPQQLTTQMAPVAPLPFSLAERDIQAIIDAYKDEPGNPKYGFKHLLFSVTEPQLKIKPAAVSDIMWAEAMGKLEGMDSANRERLWPQLVQSFKDLSHRLKLQDEVIISDADRLRTTQGNVKTLQRHFQADTLPRIKRLKQREQGLQRRLLRMMRIVEALEGKGCRMPLMKGEVELAEKLALIGRQLKGSGAELTRRVQNLLTVSRVQSNANGGSISIYLPGSTKIHERSLADMQEVLQQQTDAIARLGNVLKRDIRDMEIIMSEDTEMIEDGR